MTDAVIEFAKWVIREGAFQAADLDGLSIQEKALELGLLTKTTYDPEKHGGDGYAEPGSDWYVFSNLLTQTDPSPAPEAQLAARTGGMKVKPLDLSNLLRHAFFEGFMIAGGSQEAAAEWWPEYDPETCPAYSRILSALSPAPEAQLAEKEAEVERLRNMLNGYGKLDAELAIAERRIEALSRTGAVKVKALDWIDDTAACPYGAYTIYKRADTMWEVESYGTFIGGLYADAEAAKAAAQADYERIILSALEPAAPEGQQEPVAFVDLRVLGSLAMGRDAVECTLYAKPNPDTLSDVAIYTRPSEQAVTEAWRPIETAPKDGTWVMLWRGHTNFGCWDPLVIGKWFEWREGVASWVWPDGLYDPYTETGRADADVDIASGYHYESNEFTHWMPLPTPPALAQEGK